MKLHPSILACALAILAAGCTASHESQGGGESTSTASPAVASPSLTDTTWKLLELAGQPARADAQGAFPDLRLDSAQSRASGNAGCNRFFGSYTQSGESLHLGPLASTRRACIDPALNAQETAYLQALDQARHWSINGDTLSLADSAGTRARFLTAAP